MSSRGKPKPDLGVEVVTGTTGAVALTLDAKSKVRVLSITAHMGAEVESDFTATLDSKISAAYDAVVYSLADAFTDVYKEFDNLILETGDKLVIACANAGNTTFGVRVVYEYL